MNRPFQPWVSGNDWTTLDVPSLGAWEPRLSISVVIPAHDPTHLPFVLAGLAAQSYPAHLLEVIVVDDGSTPPIILPDLRPSNTRVVQVIDGWGRAVSCQLGADHSDGDILHWLDSDMVPARHEVEAQLRWHHLIDYAVPLADKRFAPADALDHLTPSDLASAIADGTLPDALARGSVTEHGWVERILHQTGRLADAGPRAMRAHVGASASVGRDLFKSSGGMPTDLTLGEDIVLGYRLREAGAVFIPDADSRCLHLGSTTAMRHTQAQNRYNGPFLADKVPEYRGHRLALPRSYEVPYAEVVMPATGSTFEAVRAAVDAQLAGGLPDVVITLIGGWSGLDRDRRPVLSDPLLDLRLTRAAYRSEPRVRFLDDTHDLSDATFRLVLPGPVTFPAGRALPKLLHRMEVDHIDLVEVIGPESTAWVERTAIAARARRTSRPWPPDRGVATPGVRATTCDADTAGFVTATSAPRIKKARGVVDWR